MVEQITDTSPCYDFPFLALQQQQNSLPLFVTNFVSLLKKSLKNFDTNVRCGHSSANIPVYVTCREQNPRQQSRWGKFSSTQEISATSTIPTPRRQQQRAWTRRSPKMRSHTWSKRVSQGKADPIRIPNGANAIFGLITLKRRSLGMGSRGPLDHKIIEKSPKMLLSVTKSVIWGNFLNSS